jgi:hypothetical protein
MKVRQNNNSNGSISSKASGIPSKLEGGKKAAKVAAIKFFADLRQRQEGGHVRKRITHIPMNPLRLVPVRITVVAPAVTGTIYTVKRSKGKKAAK